MSVDTRLNPNLANLDALAALDRQGPEGRQLRIYDVSRVSRCEPSGLQSR
jgi:hypothetical protein